MKRDSVISPNHEIVRWERVKVAKSRTWQERGGSEREHSVERLSSTLKEDEF